ncbi:copper-binding protein [Streptomyces sp. NPDC032472]|uniref:copper-binding protein n=1 Tax=Streptomyces sp. NPDC032472 TaxID=3155018 RepID=UPI0033D5FC0B
MRSERRTRSRAGAALGGVVLAAAAAACGGGTGGGTAAAPPPAPPVRSSGTTAAAVSADLSDFRIELSRKAFTAGAYTFTVNNTGHHDHALEIEGPGGEQRSPTLEPGQHATFSVTLKEGRYEVYCPVDGHADLGMKTGITVGATPSGSAVGG